ncbi:MAG: restriction endonuclease subunit S, partial [Dolichospermum sp.]
SINISGKLKPDHNHKRVSRSDFSLIKNDLVMILSDVAHGNFLGLTDIIPSDNYVLNQRIGGLRPKKNIEVRFASLYINHNQKYFKLHGQGSSQLNLSKDDVLNFNLPVPDYQEQTKIANFLTTIDEKISQTQTYLETVKQYKQGLLQQMFI